MYACVALLLTACSDNLFDITDGDAGNGGLQFRVTTLEMGHEVVDMGRTRSGGATAGVPDEGDRFVERLMEGDNTFGLKVQRQPVPLMGFNREAVKATAAAEPAVGEQSQGALSRAGANEVVNDITNFHDSLTIWGYTENGTKLFGQILLTKVRNWRNSVEWPYAQDENGYMKFYAVAPSLESVNISASGADAEHPISYNQPPLLTYTLPEESDELIDLLYGESDKISIASGPAGSVSTNPEDENLGKDNKFIDLRFRHITTAVRFSQGTIPSVVTINSIKISGSRRVGTYNPAATDASTGTLGAWTFAANANVRDYAVTASHIGTGNANVSITGTPTLFLLPQTLPTGATLTVELTEKLDDHSTKNHTLTCSLQGDVWKKGYTVDYKITIGRMESGYYLSTESNEVELEHSTKAVGSTLGVNSYRLYYDYTTGEKVASYSPVNWDVDSYSETGEDGPYKSWATRPSGLWLTDFRGSVLDNVNHNYVGGNGATALFSAAGQTMKYAGDHNVVLSANSQAKPASGWDLSRKYPDGTDRAYEPANCYIINRSGSYYIPVVYGNMKANNPDQKSCFKDHLGNTIKMYKIKDQLNAKSADEAKGQTAANVNYLWSSAKYGSLDPTVQAVLLWEEKDKNHPDFITNVTFSTTYGIGFTVGRSIPGNAVIALQVRKVNFEGNFGGEGSGYTQENITYGEWETAWTWHIWMTDEVYPNEGAENNVYYDAYYINGSKTTEKAEHIAQLKNADGTNTYKILPVDLGWVPDSKDFGIYEQRRIWIKLKQAGTVNTAVVKFTQHARQELYTGTGTVYQWGRPTPFPALRNIAGTTRDVIDIDGNTITDDFELAQATNGGDAISMPFKVLQWETNANSWFDVSSSDYATANAMWNSAEKTVYDPCPAGFRVPPAKVFYGFSKKSGTTGSEKTIVHGTGDEAGMMNMWPDSEDLNGVTQTSAALSKGAYFFCKANETNRYGEMVYMPATGEWHGNKSVGTELDESTEQLNQPSGLFWTSDYINNGNSQACMLWITPSYSHSTGTADKPVLGFFDEAGHKENYYDNLRNIRPMKIE